MFGVKRKLALGDWLDKVDVISNQYLNVVEIVHRLNPEGDEYSVARCVVYPYKFVNRGKSVAIMDSSEKTIKEVKISYKNDEVYEGRINPQQDRFVRIDKCPLDLPRATLIFDQKRYATLRYESVV